MKKTRRFMAAAMALTMVSALAPMSAFADTVVNDTSNPAPTTAGLDVSYTYTSSSPGPTYTVTIPAGVTLSDSAAVEKSITAESVTNMEENGKKIVVTLDSASNNEAGDSTFKAKNGDSEATYTISSGETAVKVGDTVAAFTADGSSALTFSKITLPASPVAGDYTETLTFGIAVEEAVATPTLADAFENGSTTAVTFKDFYNDYNETTITFTKNNDQYSYSSSRSDPTVRSFTQSGDKIIIICGSGDESYGEFTITLDKSDNSYSVSDPDDYYEVHELQSVVVNGVDIKDTLSKK